MSPPPAARATAPANKLGSHGVDSTVDICGLGKVPLDANDPFAAGRYIGEGFDNDGTVHLVSGNLQLQSGNSGVATDSGAYSLDASTNLQLSGGTRTFAGAATVTGTGTLALQGGTAVFNGTAVGGTSIANLAHSGGTAQGTFTITGQSEQSLKVSAADAAPANPINPTRIAGRIRNLVIPIPPKAYEYNNVS